MLFRVNVYIVNNTKLHNCEFVIIVSISRPYPCEQDKANVGAKGLTGAKTVSTSKNDQVSVRRLSAAGHHKEICRQADCRVIEPEPEICR